MNLNKLAKVGTVLLIVCMVLMVFKLYITLSILLFYVLVIDLYLVYMNEKTITQWTRPQLKKPIDILITVGLVVAVFIFTTPELGLVFLMGTINGHLNGDW